MPFFSERYGYTKSDDVIIREKITEPIKVSILNWLHQVEKVSYDRYANVELLTWMYFLNKDSADYYSSTGFSRARAIVLCPFINDARIEWYEKLNMLEFIIPHFRHYLHQQMDQLLDALNQEFQRHNFAYRIINDKIEEITAQEEMETINMAMTTHVSSVRVHLDTALRHASVAQANPDYRNSIKESISAVEAYCREITGESTLDKALGKLEAKGIILNPLLKNAFEKLYYYTNDKRTGIRHAWMDESNPPSSDEAIFMIVTCSAFINYLTKKNLSK